MAEFKSLDEIIRKACAFNPEKRFRDANELKDALERISKRDLFYERIGVNFIKKQYNSLKQNIRSIGRVSQQQVESLLDSVFYGEDILKERSKNPIHSVMNDSYISVEGTCNLKFTPPDKKYRVNVNRNTNISVALGDTAALNNAYSKFSSELESDLKPLTLFNEIRSSITFLNNIPPGTAGAEVVKQLDFLRSQDVVNCFGNFKIELDIGYYKKIAEFILDSYESTKKDLDTLGFNQPSIVPFDFSTKIKSGLNAVKGYNGIYVGDLKNNYIVRLVLNRRVA